MDKLRLIESVKPLTATSEIDVRAVLIHLANSLSELHHEIRRNGDGARVTADNHAPSPVALYAGTNTSIQNDVRRARSMRELRKRILGEDLFSGPPWDILLHLYESHLAQLRDCVGNVCDGAAIPPTTAFRWLNRLESEGLILLRDDPLDGRRRFVELTATGVEAMTKYFTGVAPHAVAA